MPRKKELSGRLRKTIIDMYNDGLGYKKISSELGVHLSIVQKIISKWKDNRSTKTLPRTGRPPKISLSTARKLVQEGVKNPRVTSRELQEQLAVSGVHVHTSTICRNLNEDDLFARMPRKKPLLTKKHIEARLRFVQQHIDKPYEFWEDVFWTNETKIEIYGHMNGRYI